MKQIKILAALLCLSAGTALLWITLQEHRLSRLSASGPVPLSLSDLEKGLELTNPWVILDDHLALYPYSLYQQENPAGKAQSRTEKRLDSVYYPVLSLEHPYVLAWKKLVEAGRSEQIPDHDYPVLLYFRVLVRTSRYSSLSELPSDWAREKPIRGLLSPRLDPEIVQYVRENWPDMDPTDILVLEQDRVPPGVSTLVFLYLVSLLLYLLAFILWRKSCHPFHKKTDSPARD